MKKFNKYAFFIGLTILFLFPILSGKFLDSKKNVFDVNGLVTYRPKSLSIEESKQLMSDKDTVVVDVRTPEEYHDIKILNSININFFAQDFKEQVAKLDKTKTYLIYCQDGSISKSATKVFSDLGFTKTYSLEGGIDAFLK